MQFILSVVLEKTVRFLTIVIDVALEEKHISILFGQTYVNGALLTISSTFNNLVCSSSSYCKKIK